MLAIRSRRKVPLFTYDLLFLLTFASFPLAHKANPTHSELKWTLICSSMARVAYEDAVAAYEHGGDNHGHGGNNYEMTDCDKNNGWSWSRAQQWFCPIRCYKQHNYVGNGYGEKCLGAVLKILVDTKISATIVHINGFVVCSIVWEMSINLCIQLKPSSFSQYQCSTFRRNIFHWYPLPSCLTPFYLEYPRAWLSLEPIKLLVQVWPFYNLQLANTWTNTCC